MDPILNLLLFMGLFPENIDQHPGVGNESGCRRTYCRSDAEELFQVIFFHKRGEDRLVYCEEDAILELDGHCEAASVYGFSGIFNLMNSTFR